MTRRSTGGFVEHVKTIVYAGLIAIGIRTIAFEPFNIPSGSMVPTLLVGDYLFVSKYSYGYSRYSMPLAPPLFTGRVFGREPARGDVAVFKLPRDTSTDYIKRIVGLPGDRIQMKQGQLYVNGTIVPRRDAGFIEASERGINYRYKTYVESLPGTPANPAGRQHLIVKESDDRPLNDTQEFRVPEGHVFAMGDNRDNSLDSRVPNAVGYIPLENLVGRAEFIFFSADGRSQWWEVWEWPREIRWSRLLMAIN